MQAGCPRPSWESIGLGDPAAGGPLASPKDPNNLLYMERWTTRSWRSRNKLGPVGCLSWGVEGVPKKIHQRAHKASKRLRGRS